MKKIICTIGVAFILGASAFARPVFGYRPSWESADERGTLSVALQDFNGDGWQYEPHEWKEGDGERHVFYLNHRPALTINEIRINGQLVPRGDYCFDGRAGWYSFKEAPGLGTLISVNYVWSNRLDLFAGNEERVQADARDVIYFNHDGSLDRTPGWLSQNEDYSWAAAEADYDGDGDVDVAICGDYFIKIYNNTGTGLENNPSRVYNLPGAGPYSLAWGDVDNDNYMELAVGDMWLDKFYVFKNNGGNLESTPSWSADFLDANAVAWGDVDADGDMDLAGACYSKGGPDWGFAYVFKNNNGYLENTPSWRNGPPGGRSQALAWGDVNDDGWLDLVKGIFGRGDNYQDPYTDIYYSNAGVLPTTPSWECDYYTHCFTSCLVDCDADGLLDLIQAEAGIVGYFRKGGTLVKWPVWDYNPGPPFWIKDIRTGDVNGDGYLDVVAACNREGGYPTGGPNKLFLNKGNIGINLKGFAASASARGVALRWEVNEGVAGFNLFRETKDAATISEPAKINAELITGRSPYRYVDADVDAGNSYRYWLEVVPLAGPAERHGPVECTVGAKTSFALAQNAPNPARGSTTVAFSVPAACEATLTVYDIAGRKVAVPFAAVAVAGANEISVDVSALAPGVYTYRLEAAGATAARRMVVIK